MKLQQSINLKSVQNARELGGYTVSDGRVIKHGLLLRTGRLKDISAEDISVLRNSYRVRHIIDFRMRMELAGAEDPTVKDAEYHHLDVIDPSVFAEGDIPEIDMGDSDLVKMTELSIQTGMLDEKMYIGFLESEFGKKAFSEFLHILLDTEPDRSVLWHCTGGKDRTGLAAMLVLSALGADEETIIDDYLLTNEYNAERITATRQYLTAKGCDEAFTDKGVLVFDAVDESFMRAAVSYLKKRYGSVEGYIRDALKISQKETESLKAKYLLPRA